MAPRLGIVYTDAGRRAANGAGEPLCGPVPTLATNLARSLESDIHELRPPALPSLPAERNAMIGRAAEFDSLAALVRGCARLVTVTGAAGMGKTRLALRYAAHERDQRRWTGGVWLCRLHEARVAEEMIGAVARTMGVPLGSSSEDAELAEELGHALASCGPVLVVLDNFEQLDARCDRLLERWLSMAPQAVLLVTSRRRLGVDGEHCLELGGLHVPPEEESEPREVVRADAVRLFVERARAVRPGYQPEADAPWLARIVRQLDGMPLAIELAAARMGVLSAQQLCERLGDRFALLRGTGGAGATTLEAALDWSWSLLGDAERAALARCSVFRGGWELAAAEHVLGAGDCAVELLASLHDHSLLWVEMPREGGAPRYRLYESVRAYATDRLDEGDEALQRHADYYVELAEAASLRATSRGDEEAVALLEREQQNVLAAFEHCLAHRERPACAAIAITALEPVFERRGPIARYVDLLERALAGVEGVVSDVLAGRLAGCHGRAQQLCGRWAEAQGWLQRAEELAQRSDDHVTLARAAIAAGLGFVTQGAFDEGEVAFARADAVLARMRQADWLRGQLLCTRGCARYRLGRSHEAGGDLREAVSLFRSAHAARDEAFALGWLGLMTDGRAPRAASYLRRSTRIFSQGDDDRLHAWHLQRLGVFEVELGENDAARASFERALTLQRRLGDRVGEATTLARSAVLPLCLGDAEAALDRLEQAIARLDERSDPLHRGEALALLAAAEALSGLGEQAEDHLIEAETLLGSLGYPDMEAMELLRGQLELCAAREALACGDGDRADALCAMVSELVEQPRFDRPSAPIRFAQRLLRDELARVRAGVEAPPQLAPASRIRLRESTRVHVADDGSWFAAEGRPRVSLSRRHALRRIVRALIERRRTELDATLTIDQLLAAGWPRERCVGTSGMGRAYTAVARLRRLGLGEALEHDGNGYRLAAHVSIERR